MLTASSIKGKLPAHSLLIDIYSSIARFLFESMVLVKFYNVMQLGLCYVEIFQQLTLQISFPNRLVKEF